MTEITESTKKKNKLIKLDYIMVKDTYLQKMINRDAPIEVIERYIQIDYNLEEKQANKMLKEIDKVYRELYQDNIDLKLFNVLEALRSPIKWSIDLEGNIIKAYPHPVVKDKRVKGIEYKRHQAYYFVDDDLFEAYCRLEDDIAEANKRKSSPKLIAEWIEMRKQGASYTKIAEQYDVKTNVVNYQVKKQLNAEGINPNTDFNKLNKDEQKEKAKAEKDKKVSKWLEMRKQGATYSEIAEQYDVTPQAIAYQVKKQLNNSN